jgi:hypothetical protein
MTGPESGIGHAGHESAGISIARLNRAEEVLNALRQSGLTALLYESNVPEHIYEEAEHQAIWIGYRVSPNIAILAIKTVIKIWPHLRYLNLSDELEDCDPPGYIHHQLFFGGFTLTATERFGLKPWTADEINAIPNKMSIEKFHEIIRRKYGRQVPASP